MPSENLLARLPDIEALRRLSQSLAMLDAILSPEWDYRYYSFNSKWSEGEMMASMRDGSGDAYFILFNSTGAIMKGFAHESEMSPWNLKLERVWPGVLENVPLEFEEFLREPAFDMGNTTFCIWRKYADTSWQTGKIAFPHVDNPDGAEEMLPILHGDPVDYREFAFHYYEKEIALPQITHIYQYRPLTEELVAALNSETSLTLLKSDIEEIGYPQELKQS